MAPLRSSPASAAGAADIQRATSARVWPRRRASVHTAGRPSCSEEMPPQAVREVAGVGRLSVDGGRASGRRRRSRWSRRPVRLPEGVLVGGLPDRRAALELGGAVRDFLGGQGEVVRAGLDGEPRRPRASRRRSAAARRRTTGAGRAPGRRSRRASAIRPSIGGVLGGARPGGEEVGVVASGCAAAVRRRSAAGPRRARSAARRSRRSPSAHASSCSGVSSGNSSTPEGSRKHLKPKTPASCSGRRSPRLSGHRAAPEADVDVHPVAGGDRV